MILVLCEGKTDPWFQTSAQCVCTKEKWSCRGAGLQREKLMLSSNGTLCTCVLQSKNYKPEFLKVDTGLRPTCWSYPWVDGCKEIIRNKEMLSVNQLLPSMYHLFIPLTLRCRNLQIQMKKSQSFWVYHFHPFFILSEAAHCCFSDANLCPTPWDLMVCSTAGFPVLQYLPEFAQILVHCVSDAI